MNREQTYHFQYTPSEIYSAHRLRFLHGTQIKMVVLIGFLAEIFLVAQQLFPQALRRPEGTTWSAPLGMAILLLGLPLLVYLVAPSLDYRINADWKKAFTLFLSKEGFRITETSRESSGVIIKWPLVKRVVENKKVIVMFLGNERVFVIIPRRLFENMEQETFFRKILSKKASINAK